MCTQRWYGYAGPERPSEREGQGAVLNGSFHTSALPSSTITPASLTIVVQTADRFVGAHLEHFDFGGDGFAGANRVAEAPVDVEEHAAGTRKVLCHYGVE